MAVADEYSNVPVHAIKDIGNGMLTLYAEVEGALIPLAEKKLGHVEAAIAATEAGHLPSAPGSKSAKK